VKHPTDQHRPHLPVVAYATAYTATTVEPGGRWTTDEATALLTECVPCQSLTAAAATAADVGTLETSEALLDAAIEAGAATPTGTLRDDGAVLYAMAAEVTPAAPDTEESRAVVNWAGVIGIEGRMTGDGRMIEDNALMWDDGPLPFFHVRQDQGYGHAGKLSVGHILTMERRPGGLLYSTGTVDLGCIESIECARLIGQGLQPGVSMDLDSVSFEIRVKMELLAEEQQIEDEGPATAAEDNPVDDEGRVTVIAINDGDEVMVTIGARVRGATSVGEPAFAEATIALTDDDWEDRIAAATAALTGDEAPMMVASGAPVTPPAEWFADPQLTGPTPMVITDEGRVYGHLAEWGTCHTSFPGQCLTPPSSPSSYSYFLTGALRTAEGTDVRVGQITMDTTHAIRSATAPAAMAHYDNTGLAFADITVGEDAYGIWFSGAVRPGVTPEQRRVAYASPVSGDWRTFRRGGGLELMAALCVNVQGFPVPRPQGLVASGQMQSLVAAGMLAPAAVQRRGRTTLTLSPELAQLSAQDLHYLQRIAAREAAHENDAAGYARRIEAAGLAARIHAH
jgi:hypothetical protein